MRNVFKYELKMILKSTAIWSVVIAAMLVMFFALFPTFASDASFMEQILKNYPEEMLKVFGMNTGLPLSSVLGYLVFTFAFIQLLLAVQSSYYGFSLLSIEEREFTADFLMSKPVSRIGILNAKIFSGLIAIIITGILTCIAIVVSIELFKEGKTYDFDKLLVLMGSIFLFQLSFFSIGLLVSVSVSKIRNVLSYALGLAFATYTLNGIRAIIGGDLIGYLTPFSHFEPGYLLVEGHLHLTYSLISMIVTILCFIFTYILYIRRDIHSL